ncbi:hypothetical protein [Haloarchaeobius litoreus]|uniref:Uncharacterized protein n=1 Tax=Haloarchaeobius litoreus TaxID=755306 RepID=A0ABD6DSE0_9EURY|nr:hypothetical protein [Haloarchaeobius litoreus]
MSEEPPDDSTGNDLLPGDSGHESRVRRRSFLTALATASAGLVAGCSETGDSTGPTSSPPETTHGYGGVPTTERPSSTRTTPTPTTTTGPGGDGTTEPGTTPPETTTPGDGSTGSGGSNGGGGGGGSGDGDATGTPAVPTVENGEAVTRRLGRGETAWVALGSTAPASLVASARRTDGTEAFAVTLYGPDGSLLAHEFVDGASTTLRARAEQTGAQHCRLSNLGTTEIECVVAVETSNPRPLTGGESDESGDDGSFEVTSLQTDGSVTETVPPRGTGWYRVDFDADVLASITANSSAADGSFALSLYEPDGGLLDHRSTANGELAVEVPTTAAGGHLVRLSNTSTESLPVRVAASSERPDDGGEPEPTTTSEPTTTTTSEPTTTAAPTTTTTTAAPTTTATTTTTTTTSDESGDDGGLAQLGYGMGGYGGASN